MAWLLEWGWVLIALACAVLSVWELRRQAPTLDATAPPPWPGFVRARQTVEEQVAPRPVDGPRTCACGGWFEVHIHTEFQYLECLRCGDVVEVDSPRWWAYINSSN
jgi:hypothetical protein